VKIPLQVEPAGEATPAVEYRWDPDTEILSAQLRPQAPGSASTDSVEVEGSDGSWLILDVASGRINGIEVAVWPDVHTRAALRPPGGVTDATIRLSERRGGKRGSGSVTATEVETPLMAEADEAERVFHFTLGKLRKTRTLRFARDLLVDVDASNNLAGLWFLNVPPFPSPSQT